MAMLCVQIRNWEVKKEKKRIEKLIYWSNEFSAMCWFDGTWSQRTVYNLSDDERTKKQTIGSVRRIKRNAMYKWNISESL